MRRKLVFLATEDWFVRSHFLPLLRRAVAENFEVVVWARDSGALAGESGLRVIDARFERRSWLPWNVSRQVRDLRRVLAHERPDVVHAIALKPILLLLQTRDRSAGRVLALTGRGFLAAGGHPLKRWLSGRLKTMLRQALRQPATVALVENLEDGRWIADEAERDRVMLMPGAGVDPAAFPVSPEPATGVVVGVLARLIRSKGVDLAIEAVGALRAEGLDISLLIGGTADRQNPDRHSDSELERWRRSPGVTLAGRVSDAPGFWRSVHIACLPSRGGEGLPRVLLEAAASGRPIVTSDAPGCRDFVAGEQIGIVAPRGDAQALAAALRRLACDAGLRRRMGEAGRAKVVEAYTEAHAAEAAARAWHAVETR